MHFKSCDLFFCVKVLVLVLWAKLILIRGWIFWFSVWLLCFLFNFILCRRSVLERTLASSDVSQEEQINLLKDLERKETQYMRLKRHKICVDDFDLLTIIGRGAYGEVRDVHVTLLSHRCKEWAYFWICHYFFLL